MSLGGFLRVASEEFVWLRMRLFQGCVEKVRSTISEANPEPAGVLGAKRCTSDTLQLSRVNGSHAVVVLECGQG